MLAAPATVRQSLLATHANCPLSAKFQLQAANVPSHPMARGTIFHDFAERLIRMCIESGINAAPPGYGKDLMLEVIRDSGLPLPPDEFEDLVRMGGDFAEETTFDLEAVVDIEETYYLDIPVMVDGQREVVRITGKPDRLEIHGDRADIYDYKTSWVTDPDGKLAGSFQLRMYAWLVLEAFPHLEKARLLLQYPRWSKREPSEATVTRNMLPTIRELVTTKVEQLLTAIAQGDDGVWEASPGSWCRYCPAATAPRRFRCPVPKEERLDGSITTDYEAHIVGRRMLVREAQQKADHKALKSYLGDEEGPGRVGVGDREYVIELGKGYDECIDKDVLRGAMETAIPVDRLLGLLGEAGLLTADLEAQVQEHAGLAWDEYWKWRKPSNNFKHRAIEASE